jgi:ESS family glutamate:Na+ symporter
MPGNSEIPMMCLSMLAGVVIQKVLDGINLGHYVDKHVMNRIGSWVTDYLVAFGVASIQISVVMQYATPMILLFLFGVLVTVGFFAVFARRVFHNFWFERGIFVYGWNTGVVAIGVTLLRVVDPGFKTKTLEDYGLAYVFISLFEIAIVSMAPSFIATGYIWQPAAVLLVGFAACIVLSRTMSGWYANVPLTQIRDGEAEIIDEFNREEGLREAR